MASQRAQRQIDRLLDEAEDAVSQLAWGIVRDRAQAVLAFDPENSDGLAFLAAAERAQANSPPPSTQPLPPPQNAPSEPTSFADGRYQVQKSLGEGGKKKVYLAHDTLLDREVAFALIKTEGLDETSRTRIQREAQAMGRLGSHTHIVTVFDLGQEQDQPYMVTELMAGGDVEGLIEDATSHRLSLEQAVNIVKETCRGLEFAHSRGIVHRDLKPGNVWLTSDGTAKIGDFGLAISLDRSRLTQEGMMVGTVSYMPPEQAMGGEVTHRSDLYSLGAMLYEMVTGRPPFLGDDAVAIIGQHINTPPVSPTWHNAQCPRPLEALIMRLLAKNPSERPESATDVLSALDSIDLTTSVEQPTAGIDEGHALDSLAGGVFVGRQREMGELKACLEDALSGRGRLVTLVGEPGIGKTRTALELATYAQLRQAQVLWGRCYEGEGAPPYWPWVQAIRSYVREVDPVQLRSDMGSGAAEIAEIVSDVRERLPDLKPPPATESPEQARFRLFDSITAFLKTASRSQPLVVILDDLHWADQPSLLLLQFVAKELGGARLLLVGTYRDVELSRQHPLAEALGELTRERLFQRVLLRGLSQQDVARFIEMAAGITPPRGLIDAVYTQTEGNPLFVTEVVRLLVQEGDLGGQTPQERESWTVRIPEGVREVIGRRLNRLSQRCNETLTYASIIGREFELRQLVPLIEDVSEDRLLEILEEAMAARVIEELPQTVGRYQFAHALIQETLTEELSLTRRVRMHARCAETLEAHYGDQADAHAAELAHHFAQAEAVTGAEKLVHYSLLAGERALNIRAYEEAAAHFQRGMAAKGVALTGAEPARDAEEAALLTGLGQAQSGTLGRQGVAAVTATLARAFDYYMASGDSERAVSIAAYHLPINTDSELIAKALELVEPGSHDAGLLQARYITPQRADYESAHDAFHSAMAIAQHEQDPALEMRTLVAAACVDFTNCRFEQSLARNLRAIELAEGVDQPEEESHARYDLMHVLYIMGDLEEATKHAAEISGLADRAGTAWSRVRATESNEQLDSAKGNWQTARNFSEQGLAASPREPSLLGCRALLEYQLGDFEAGETYLARLLESVQQGQPGIPTPPYTIFNLGTYTILTTVIPIVARITGVMARFEVVEAIAQSVSSSPAAHPGPLYAAKIGLALIAVQRSDVSAAEELYGALESIRGTMFPQCPLAPGLSTDRLLGLLSQTTDNLEKSAEHFEDSLAFCRKGGFRPELAWTCCDYADMIRERDAKEDRAKTMALLDESLAISSELGMRPLMERVLSRREILGA